MKSKTVNPGKAIQGHLSCLLSACAYVILFCASVCGLDRDRTIAQFHHTSWTAKDGAPSQISALAQTADGYLWIGSAKGLFRFDGVQFETYAPPGIELPSHNIYALMPTSDGGLWISFRPTGLGFVKDGRIEVFSRPEELPNSQVYCFTEDLDGRIWAGTHDGLVLRDGSNWIEIGLDWNFKPQIIRTLFTDKVGTLWVTTDETIRYLPRGSNCFRETDSRVSSVPRIAQANDGRLWMAETWRSVRPVPVTEENSDAQTPEIMTGAQNLFFDRDGAMWLTTQEGLVRVRYPERLGNRKIQISDAEVELFGEKNGLSGDYVNQVLEDREGNIWVSTAKGIDRFRHSHLVSVYTLPGHQNLTLVAGDGGEIWAGSSLHKPLTLIRGNEIIPRISATNISSFYRDRERGIIWWGVEGGIWQQRNGRFDFFPQPADLKIQWIWEVIRADADGGLWVGFDDDGLIYFKDGVWNRTFKPEGLLERVPSASYHDQEGRVWLGYTENRVFVMETDGRVRRFTSQDGLDIGRIRVIRGRHGYFWFGGELGLALFDGNRFRTIRKAGGERFGTVSGIVETAVGALWLNEIEGVVYISADDARQAVENLTHEVNYRVYDFLDALPGTPQMNWTVSTAVEATDGKLWFATDNGLAWIDPANISKNPVPPPVLIRSLQTEERSFDLSPPLNLPEGTTDLRIDYTALSLSIPERVHFRYKLEGVDNDWHAAGIRRQAFYNNLGPGHYQFRVIACNNDGVWNETGATLDFRIKPMFYQTLWFRFLIFLLAILLTSSILLLLYRWRLAHATERLKIGFEERLAERTRIAHDLHDTLLQGFFGASMRLQAVSNLLSGESEKVKENLDNVLDQMDVVLEEGRRAIWDMHALSVGENDLIHAFTRAGEDLNKTYPADFSLTIEGETRPLHPLVRDQIYRIGREALTNAFRHSQASKIELEIEFAPKHLRLVIRDNGCGISPDYLSAGREGHLGLSGMREYAEKIGAELKIWSRAESGTEVELIVPHQIAFEKKSSDGLLSRMSRFYNRKTAPHRSNGRGE